MKKLVQSVLLLIITSACFSQPIKLHPDNPHYFLYKGKPFVIVSSSEHYGAVLNPAFDMIRYLNTMQKEGMTYTRLFTGSYFEKEGSFGIELNTLAPAPGSALVPWRRSNVPGAACGGNKFDLDQWDDNYFKRLKIFVGEAGNRGIIVEITLFSSIYGYWDIQPFNPENNITIKETVTKENILASEKGSVFSYQEKLIRKIVRELNGFDNVIYEIQNEPWADHPVDVEPNSEFANNTDFRLDGHEWQKKIEIAGQASLDWQKRIASVIADEEKKMKKKHLIAQNYSNFYYPVPEVDENVSILNFHYAYPLAVEINYWLPKVTGFDESGFSGTADSTYRKQAWKFIISGGGLFNNLDYSFAVGFENGKAQNKAPGGGSTELRKQLKVLSDFMHSFDFIRMRPEYGTALPDKGVFARVLAEKGKQYAVYVSNGTSCKLKLLIPEGTYLTEWISTRDGSKLKTENVRHRGGELILESPKYSEDIALRILKQ